MRVSFVSEPAPGHENEDFVACTPDALVLLDGAGTPPALEMGCLHGVAWYARQLGACLLERVATTTRPLRDCLADAIERTAAQHQGACDLDHPLTPSATVVLARVEDAHLHWLVLADSTLVQDAAEGLHVVSDHRVSEVTRAQRQDHADELDRLSPRERVHFLVHRQREALNTVGGYWAAASSPKAAEEAITGTTPLPDLRMAAALSDGAARPVDDFAVMDWPGLLAEGEAGGPQAIIAAVRAHEYRDPDAVRWPRTKIHDDATAAVMHF